MGKVKLSDRYYLVWGNATKNAELKRVGTKQTSLTTFSVAYKEDYASDQSIYVDCKAWRRNAEPCARIKKGDYFAAIGEFVKSTNSRSDGTPYVDFVIDVVLNTYTGGYQPVDVQETPINVPTPKFEDLSIEALNDDDLPF